MNLNFYRADTGYCDFLSKTDPTVPCTSRHKSSRPFVGIVLSIGGLNYFAPLSSPKPKHIDMRNQVDFLKICNGSLGAINLNNMIPIHSGNLHVIDMVVSPSDSRAERDYKNLLNNQLSWCNANMEVIVRRAEALYHMILSKHAPTSLINRCCNFLKNEEQYRLWCVEHGWSLTRRTSVLTITKDKAITKMVRTNAAAAAAKPGDTVIFESADALGGQLVTENDPPSKVSWDNVNPATGPLFVEGAKPGDILKVSILSIETEDHGVMTVSPGFGALGEVYKDEETRIIRISDGHVIFGGRKIPAEPMIGVIGTAPEGEGILCGTPGLHGGNMDCSRIVAGSVVYLPVFCEGALLAMGDVHALMGDGEILGCGVECGAKITVKVDLLSGVCMPLPLLVQGGKVMTIASAETLDEAGKQATLNMHKLLTEKYGLPQSDAGMLMSLIGSLRICQVVDPLMTARMEFPLEGLGGFVL